jgi:hypothetical protein
MPLEAAFMTPECNAESFLLQGLGRRQAVARFDWVEAGLIR